MVGLSPPADSVIEMERELANEDANMLSPNDVSPAPSDAPVSYFKFGTARGVAGGARRIQGA